MQPPINYKISAALLILLFTGYVTSISAQRKPNSSVIEVTFNKTSSLVFPQGVTAVDRGSRDILVQKVSGARNVLHLKAARPAFSETNLTVITVDGAIHEFPVVYAANPKQMVTHVGETDTLLPVVLNENVTETELAAHSARLMKSSGSGTLRRRSSGKVTLSLRSIGTAQDMLFLHLEIRNRSRIGYDTDILRFFIGDKKQVRRTASQERDLQPSHTSGELDTIPGRATRSAVISLNKLTIPDAKRLVIEVFEQNGGRHLRISIPNHMLVRAKSIQ